MGRFGWAYIGSGGIAGLTASELMKGETGRVVAVWNRTKSRAEEFAKAFGAKVYDTPEEAINAEDVGGVYIAVTADKHAEYTKLCIKNHKPVLCEKPFAVNRKEAEEVIEYAKKENVYVAEAMWTWFNEPAYKYKEWVDSGKIGKIKSAKGSFCRPMIYVTDNPRLTTNEMIGGGLMDIGIYVVTYAYRLFGKPDKITCKGKVRNRVDIAEDIVFDYPGFSVQIKVAMDKIGREYFNVYGEDGTIKAPVFHAPRKIVMSGKNPDIYRNNELFYDTEFRHVAEEIREGLKESRYVPFSHTLDVMEIMDECRRQMGVKYPGE